MLPASAIAITSLSAARLALASHAQQAPFAFDHRHPDTSSTSLWSLDAQALPNTTDSALVFDSLASLLHTWPNARYRNGHTIVAGSIPAGTFLHHGTNRNEAPSTPEWTALDPEFSYMFCHTQPRHGRASTAQEQAGDSDGGNGGCWHLTLLVTRPLKILYFDGSSATKTYGALDAQDLIVFGEDFSYSPGEDQDNADRVWDEPERLRRLCAWGKKYELDGFVRMQASFEVMICNFTSPSLTTHSFLNLASKLESPRHDLTSDGPPYTEGSAQLEGPDQPTLLKLYRALESGLRNAHTPERRVHLDWTRIISFYDPHLFPSLSKARARAPYLSSTSNLNDEVPDNEGKSYPRTLFDVLFTRQNERGTWRVGPLGGISRHDRDVLMARLDVMLSPSSSATPTTNYDWPSIYDTFKTTYAERLSLLHYMLHSDPRPSDHESRLRVLQDAHLYIDGILTPYLLYSVRPHKGRPLTSVEDHYNATSLDWASPIFKACAIHSLPPLPPSLPLDQLGDSERLAYVALAGTSREVCRVLVRLWAQGVEAGLVGTPNASHTTAGNRRCSLGDSGARSLLEEHRKALNGLMYLLDWSSPWVTCTSFPSPSTNGRAAASSDRCSFEEVCYLPTWPMVRPLWPAMRFVNSSLVLGVGGRGEEGEEAKPDISSWEFPRPKCIRRVGPWALPFEV